jgi:hypothetical protein
MKILINQSAVKEREGTLNGISKILIDTAGNLLYINQLKNEDFPYAQKKTQYLEIK